MFQSWDLAPMLENINLSYVAQKDSGMKILKKKIIYRRQMSINAEF